MGQEEFTYFCFRTSKYWDSVYEVFDFKDKATYDLKELTIEECISNKKYFYWMSSTAFNYVRKNFPEIIKAKHACGPGNTYKEIKKIIKNPDQLTIALSYNSWRENLLNDS